MHGCHAYFLPAADRVVWPRFRRCGFCFSSVACFGVVELKRGIFPSCGGLCVWTQEATSDDRWQLSRCRAGCTARRAPLQPARHSCVRRLLSSSSRTPTVLCLDATGAFFGRLGQRLCWRLHVFFQGFRTSAPQNAQNFLASRGGRSQGRVRVSFVDV